VEQQKGLELGYGI